MAHGQLYDVVQFLRRLSAPAGEGGSDRQLLARFAAARDQEAFAQLVRRHGPMVFGVCRRLLGHRQDAEDALQATFLVLARQAAARTEECVGPWLHGVACKIALHHRRTRARRRLRDSRAVPMNDDPTPDAGAAQLAAVLDEALKALPDALRQPLVLCLLEGRPRAEAAKHLNLPLRTLERRLSQAKEALRHSLEARGVALSAGAVAALLSAAGPAPLSASVVQRLTELAAAFAAGKTALLSGAEGVAVALANEFLAGSNGAWKALVAVLALSLTMAGDSRVNAGIPFEPERQAYLARKAAAERQRLVSAQKKLDELAPRLAKSVEAMIVYSKADVVKTWFDGPEAHVTLRWRMLPIPGSEAATVRLTYHYPRRDFNTRFDWPSAKIVDRWVNPERPFYVAIGGRNFHFSGQKELAEIRTAFEELQPFLNDCEEPPGDIARIPGTYRWEAKPCTIEVVDRATGRLRIHFPRSFGKDKNLSESVLDATIDTGLRKVEVYRDGQLVCRASFYYKPSGAHMLMFGSYDWWTRDVDQR